METDLTWISGVDYSVFETVNKTFTSSLFDTLMPILSNVVYWMIPLGIAWVIFFFMTDRRGKTIALCAFIVVAATDQISSHVVKPAIQRDRPCNVVPSTHLYQDGKWQMTDKFALTRYSESFSFPSSHATNMAGQAMYWSYYYPEIAPVMIVAAAAVGFSRVYLGVHWPIDVMAGYILGIVIALVIAYPLREWILPREET